MGNALPKARLAAAGLGAFFRPRDVEPLGITFRQLQRLAADGVVERVGGGLYRLTAVEPTELETIAMVASAVPRAIVCLLTALTVHLIGTQVPHDVWIALDRKSRRPARPPAKLRIVRFSGVFLTYGVITMPMLGVRVSITSPARTVVDCFRYRRKVGLDVAMEALRDAIRTQRATADQIWRTAEVCRIQSVLGPYMEALSA